MEKIINADNFNCCKVINGLSKNKPAKEQEDVVLSYLNQNNEMETADLCHGIICIFLVAEPIADYYILGVPQINTDKGANNAYELQASIGDNKLLQNQEEMTILQSLNDMIKGETYNFFSLNDFNLSPYYVIHRVADWNLCYIKLVALAKLSLSLNELQQRIISINSTRKSKGQNPYGIYKLDEIVKSANKTAELSEGEKSSTNFINYCHNQTEQFVILDDRAIDELFKKLDYKDIDALFPRSVATIDNIVSLNDNYSEQTRIQSSLRY